jgi:uncharacterized protein YjgD (DUF1641 family)
MALPVLLSIPHKDPREVLFHRLENAPQDHAEALLAAYDVLQALHDKGLLEIAKGALGSGEKVLEIIVNAANQPEVIQGIRNLIVLTKLLAAIDPKLLEHLAGAVPDAMNEAKTGKPLGLFALAGKATSQDTRRALTVMLGVAEALGKSLGPEKSAPERSDS